MTISTSPKSRIRVAAVAAALASVGLVAGCAGAPDDVAGDELTDSGPIAITWYGSDARNAAVQSVVDSFASENPDVEIETQPTTFEGYWDRLSIQAAANNIPCVTAMQSRYEARYENLGSLMPLDGLVEDGTIDVSGIPKELLDSQRAADGNLYVIPYGAWYEGVVLNEPAIEEAGLTVPDPEGTWDDYVEWGRSVLGKTGAAQWPMSDRGGEITQFQAYAIGRGEELFEDDGSAVAFSEDTLAAWFELWAGAIEDGVVPPAQSTAEQVGIPSPQTDIANGRVLITSTGDNNISDFQITLDQSGLGAVSIASSPTGGNPQVVGTNGWGISTGCGNAKAAAAFIDYFVNNPDAAFTLQTQTGLPPVSSVLEELTASDETSDIIRQRAALFEELVAAGAVIDVWPDNTQKLVNDFRTAYEEVAFGQRAAGDVAADFIAQANTALAGI